MTTTDTPGQGDKRLARMRLAHRFDKWSMVGPVVIAAVLIAGHYLPDTYTTPLTITNYALCGVYLGLFMLAGRHDSSFCLDCYDEFPAQPSMHAEHHRLMLMAYHLYTGPIVRLVRLVGGAGRFGHVGFVAVGVLYSLVPIAAAALLLPMPWSQVVFVTVVWTLWRMVRVHARFAPWCPWCRDNNGGGGEQVDTPTPDPAGVRSRL